MNNKKNNVYYFLWRWHFYAGLFLGPLIILLAATGLIYLFKPQLNASLLHKYRVMPGDSQMISYDKQLHTALDAYPGSTLKSFTYNHNPNEPTEITLTQESRQQVRVFVDPYQAEVVGALPESHDVMLWAKILHSGAVAGDKGRVIMELAGCWTIVLLISGVYLWWPRLKGKGGVVSIRRKDGKRNFLRDLHAVPAIFLSAFVFIWILTGLPWTITWGGLFDKIATATKTNAPAGFWSPFKAEDYEGKQHISLDKLVEIQKEYIDQIRSTIHWPWDKESAVIIRTDMAEAQDTVYLHVDQYTGDVYADYRWKDFGLLGKYVSVGVGFHEGRLFGWPNQVLGIVVTVGVIWLTGTGIFMWWKRRPKGKLGAPTVPENFVFHKWFLVFLGALCIFLPLFGASVVVLWILDPIFLYWKTKFLNNV